MKIALIVPGGVDRSGRERVIPILLWLIERLARRHSLHVFVLDYYAEPCSYELLGARIHDLGRVTGPPGFRRVRVAARLAAALRKHGPFDILHAYWGMPAGIVGTAVAEQIRVPVVVTLSSGELMNLKGIGYGLQRRWLDRRAVRRMLQRSSAITVPTSYMASQLAPHRRDPLIIPMGVDSTRFVPSPRVDGPPWRLIRVASINRVKDYPTLLRALSSLPDSIALDIVGEDTLGGAIQRLAVEYGIDRRVTFHGWQPTDRLALLYQAAHLNVVSSRHEASNVTMLEAACAGIPSVGTLVGYVADWHPDRAVGVPIGDSPALAEAISSLLRDSDRREQIAANARQWALAHDADWTANAFEALYNRVIRA
jgi:glycosyltransferase involved in cell wall biosynthesis